MENLQIWLRTPLRTFEAEIAQKNKNIQAEQKKGVLLKKREYLKICKILRMNLYFLFQDGMEGKIL